jgi:hypothetical protein
MLFRQHPPRSSAIETAQMEELRRQDARRALERECRTLRRQFAALEKEHSLLRVGHESQCKRLDSMVVQSGALLTLIDGMRRGGGADQPGPLHRHSRHGEGAAEAQADLRVAVLEGEKRCLVDDRALLLRRNAELEAQIESVMTQFGSLLADYEDVRGKLDELKGALAKANSIEELGGWEQL